MIRERRAGLKLVIVAGPSSSGKTTTTIKLTHLLTRMGMKLVPLTVDNYFFDLELHPKDEYGDYDFETPQALDLPLINEHLRRLIAGEEVRIPFYDFKTGKRHNDRTPMRVGPDEVILIDSLHGLYADMTQGVDERPEVPALPGAAAADEGRRGPLRPLDRSAADAPDGARCRSIAAYNPQRTLEHWHYVRTSEKRNILPYVSTADYVVNTGLPYELPVMRARLFDHFERWVDEYRDDPLRTDAFERAARVAKLLRAVTPVADESTIPPDSLLREFIGGSCYTY